MKAPATQARGGFLRVAILAVGGLGFALWAAWSTTKARETPGSTDAAAPTSSALTVWTATGPPPRETSLTGAAEAGPIHNGVLSRDGEVLLWEDQDGIWRRPRAGGPREELTLPDGVPADAGHLWDVFSDGQRLLLGADEAPTALLTVDLRTQSVQLMRELAFSGQLSHDEQLIAIADPQGLAILAIDGARLRRLVAAEPADRIHSVAWSPDDRFVLFRTRRLTPAGRQETVEVVSRDGDRRHRIAEGSRLGLTTRGTVAWPKPDQILYVRAGPAGTRDSELWARQVRDGSPTEQEPRRVYIWPDVAVSRLCARGGLLSFVRKADRDELWLLEGL